MDLQYTPEDGYEGVARGEGVLDGTSLGGILFGVIAGCYRLRWVRIPREQSLHVTRPAAMRCAKQHSRPYHAAVPGRPFGCSHVSLVLWLQE